IAADRDGSVYAADIAQFVVRKITADGAVTIVAGNGTRGFSGDGGLAVKAQLNTPSALALDRAGNLYLADTFNHRVRKVSTDGIITTIAGTGTDGLMGDGGPALTASFGLISGLAADDDGNIYIADLTYNAIRRLSPWKPRAF